LPCRRFYGIAWLCNKGLAKKYGKFRSAKFKKKLWIKHIGGFFKLTFANLQKNCKNGCSTINILFILNLHCILKLLKYISFESKDIQIVSLFEFAKLP